MSIIIIIQALLIGKMVTSMELEAPSEINRLTSTESVFPVQIQTTEKTLAASAGNNLNAMTSNIPYSMGEQKENFRAILPTHYIAITNSGEKMKSDQDDGGGKLLLSLNGNYHVKEILNNDDTSKYITKPSSLYWDNCFDRKFKYSDIISNSNNDLGNAEDLKISVNSNVIPSVMNKRDSVQKNYSIINTLLEKYNNFMNTKMEENNLIDDIELSTTYPSTTVRIIPITEIILGRKVDSINFDNTVTDNSVNEIKQNGIESKDESKIKFSRSPQTQNYLIPKFKLGEGLHPFTFMSKFFSAIYPFEYPVDPVKDIVSGKFSFPFSFLQHQRIKVFRKSLKATHVRERK